MVNNSSNFSSRTPSIVKYPILTEKSTKNLQNNLAETKQYSFVVDRYSDKRQIKAEIENLFQVKIIKINTCRLPRKQKRVGKYLGYKPLYKKAIVKLAKDNQINLFGES